MIMRHCSALSDCGSQRVLQQEWEDYWVHLKKDFFN